MLQALQISQEFSMQETQLPDWLNGKPDWKTANNRDFSIKMFTSSSAGKEMTI